MTGLAPRPAAPVSPRISVVLTTYNRAFLLPRTLPSVYRQDIPPTDYELIVVVDGSSDGTIEYLNSARPPCRMIVIEQPNRGAAAARNAGLREARGPIVLLMDDDLLCPPWLLRHHFEAHRGHARRVVYGATNTARQSPRSLAADLTRKSSSEATMRLESGAPRPGAELALDPNCSLPRSLITGIGGFDESFLGSRETCELALRLRDAGVQFHYLRDAAVDEVYVKSAGRLGSDDAFAAGANEVRLRRKHPRYKAESALANMAEGSALRRTARRAAATLPGVDFLVSLPMRMCESLRMVPAARDIGVQLLRWRQGINLYRGALCAAGSWHRLADEFGAVFPCLLYHHVGPSRRDTYAELTIAPARFEQHLQWLRNWGYQGITPSQWARWRTGRGPLPRRPVMLTFDDAYADTAEYAFPLLKQYGFPAAVFAVAGELGGTNRWDEALGSGSHRLMDEGQIRRWAANGIEFGAHSMTHADLTRLPAQQARHEIERSRDMLAGMTGQPLLAFSYPYGYHDGRTEAIAQSCFDLAFTTLEGRNSLATNPHRLRRTMVLPDDRRGDLFSRLRLGYSLRHRSMGRLARLPSWLRSRMQLRAIGKAIPALRSGWYLALELKAMAGATLQHQHRQFENLFAGGTDPWGYRQGPQQERFGAELRMILAARGGGRVGAALEIGCAEGAFTGLLAGHCDSLLAVDFSATALSRARQRAAWPASVQFRELDIVRDPLPQPFDLIVVAHVLDDLARPWRMRTIRRKLVAALAPGGLLLVGNPRANRVIENSWWGRLLVRGGTWIDRFISRDCALDLVAQTKTGNRIDSLYRRRQPEQAPPMPAIRALPAIKSALGRVPGLRSLYQQARILGSIAYHRFVADQPELCDLAHTRQDWNFGAPAEQERYRRVVRSIESVRGARDWGKVLEIGCSEGLFTAELARHCRSVTAVDLSRVACDRAAERCAQLANVAIAQGNIRDVWAANSYDVIFAMCVWEYLQGRDQHSAAARNIICALRPGGLLVLNATRLPPAYESTWWARLLVSGGVQIVRFLAEQDDLDLLCTDNFTDYTIAIFRKAGAPQQSGARP